MLHSQILKSAQQFRSDKFDLASIRMQNLSQQNPKSLDCLVNLGAINLTQNNFDEAQQYFTKAVEIDPYDFRPHYNLFALFWKTNKQAAAYSSLCKCISTLYAIKVYNQFSQNIYQDLSKAIKFWPGNASAYVLKCINLIKESKLEEASDVTKQALEKCHSKHQIYAICCIIDSRLNRQAERQQNAKDYYAHLLRPLVFSRMQSHGVEQEINSSMMSQLVQQFNSVSSYCYLGDYRKFRSHPNVAFMTCTNTSTVDVGLIISKNLGMLDLVCIQEQQKVQDGEDNEKQPEQSSPLQDSLIKDEDQVQNTQPNKQSTQQKHQSSQQKPQKDQLLYPITCPSFYVKLISADLNISQELIGKMDPYVYYEYGAQKTRTVIAKGQGNKPRWKNEIKNFSLQRNPTFMKISIYDREMFGWDALVGTGEVLIKNQGLRTVPIFLNGKPTGEIVVFIEKKTDF